MNESLDQALKFHKNGNLDKAEKIYLNILKKNSTDASLLQLLGTLNLQKKNYKISEDYFLKSLELKPEDPVTLNNLGILNRNLDNIDKSIEYFEKNIKKNNFLNSWINKSNILIKKNNYLEGLEFTKLALKNYPDNNKLKNNLALFLFECGFKKKALSIYEEFNSKKLHFEESLINYSNILIKTNNFDGALEVLNEILFYNKNNIEALRSRSFIFKEKSDFKNAQNDLLLAIKIDASNLDNHKILVELYFDYKEYQLAIDYCDKMISKNIETDFFLTKKILSKMNLGIWIGLEEELDRFNKNLNNFNSSLNPLSLKYLNDNPIFQKEFTEKYWDKKPKNKFLSKIIDEKKNFEIDSKIRIGYFSGDFKNHAVFQLIQDLFIYHDKSQFEIYAYSSFKKEGNSRNKVKNNVDKFTDIDNLSDEEILNIIKIDNLDIAIDLSGYTTYNKSHLFEYNISKIKINYLGYPGSMGTNNYDYIIADKNIIPPDHSKFYTEDVIYMPETYQPFTPYKFDMNLKKSEFGLLENKFILGCFSRIEKIHPNIFNIWMKIINKYKDTHLALCVGNKSIQNNIRDYCELNNFDFERIIFLEPIEHKNNLRRISTFDLYLDTFPYNGHTGISDSLFQCCVPTISLTGNSFASRVSYSLLNSLNLPELITHNKKDYQEKIDFYCCNRQELLKIRKYLLMVKDGNYNRMKKFTKDFEHLMRLSFTKYLNNKDN